MESLELNQFKLKSRHSDGKIYFLVSDLETLPEWPESPMLELLYGELYMVPPPNTEHQEIVNELLFQFKSFLKNNPVGRVFTGPYDIIFSDEDSVIPDLIFVKKNNEKIITSKNIQGSPDLIVEVVSTNRKHDFIDKRNLYEKYKIKEYWIIDPRNKKVFIYELNEFMGYNTPLEFNFGEEIKVKNIQGFSIKIL